MRWWTAALTASGVGREHRRRIGGGALAAGLGLALAGGGTAAERAATGFFTGYGFDACNAPKTAALQSWLASPYRALGIYIGGVNRTCANAQLSPDWVATAEATGWSLIPIYVGLQAPCVGKSGLARFGAASASALGAAAADDAVSRAGALGLPGGSPIYFDMEAYALANAACTQTVQTFVSSWVAELHAQGYVAGVYGSAASTMRDLQPLASTAGAPDDVWIADWNGVESVFGDPYVSDSLWTNHQRLHQYRGGHNETWGGVTINVDSSYLDGAVVGATGSAPAAPPPTPAPAPAPAPASPALAAAGSVTSSDGQASASWPAGAFGEPVVVVVTPATPTQPVTGFGSGGYGVRLQVQQTANAQPVTSFGAPLAIHIAPQPGSLAPMTSTNGSSWKPLPQLVGGVLPAKAKAGYVRQPDGSFDIQTTTSGYFALLPDTTRPPAPASLTGHFTHGTLVLQWPKSTDQSGAASSYQVSLTNQTLLSVTGQTTAALRAFHPDAPSVYRVRATDAAGNVSGPSKPLVVLPTKRPAKTPRALPAWAWKLFRWQQSGRPGPRPDAPKTVPAWYWRWAAWRAYPFHIRA
jgi:Rv2525c-like, glycoside hydrolase-like domain